MTIELSPREVEALLSCKPPKEIHKLLGLELKFGEGIWKIVGFRDVTSSDKDTELGIWLFLQLIN